MHGTHFQHRTPYVCTQSKIAYFLRCFNSVALDIYSYRIIVPIVSSSEGALMRRHGGREGMRRPRAGIASLPPGGPGSRPSLLRGTALRWAERGADEGGR